MKKSILYFIQGPVPTSKESKEAQAVEETTGIRVQLRNAQWAQPGDDDFRNFIDVIGSVPSFYKIAETSAGPDYIEKVSEMDQDTLDAQLAAYMATGAVEIEVKDENETTEVVQEVTPQKTILEEAQELPPVAVSPLKNARGRPSKAKSRSNKE